MGFIQKLAKRNPRVYLKKVKKVSEVKISEVPVIQKKDYKYYINPKNWFKWL
tara:strand:- start:1428 stop:1583 length:156 start_codon:yes stop_codon:yes gene_type:complete